MGGISVRVIAEDVMLHICLETARNPAINVNPASGPGSGGRLIAS